VLVKRVVRLALAPGVLPYALLVGVIALIWATTGRLPLADVLEHRPASDGGRSTSAITYRGGAGPGAAPITRDQAIGNVRRFAEEPDLQLDGGLQGLSPDGRGGEAFFLESTGPARGEDVFKVDARTGEVIEATMRSRLSPRHPPAGTGRHEAEQLAARFAEARFFGFGELSLVDGSSRASEQAILHSFKWSKLAEESGAELPVSVSAAVSSASGEVVWYLAQRDPVEVDVRPLVDRARAIQTATAGLGGREARWETEAPLAVRLQVLYDEQNQQQLVWSVTFRARQVDVRPSLRLLVNAHTGQLITGPS
jgi:hypothetical protein